MKKISKHKIALTILAMAIGATTQMSVQAQYSSPPSNNSAQNSQGQTASLLAPIALYPDALVAQILMSSTYPLEVAEAYNWQTANPNVKGNALANALKSQNWDPSVKSLLSFPSVLSMMGTHLTWVQNVGNAYLADQKGVMNTIQDLRARARNAGTLNSTSQQVVSNQNVDGEQVIVIQPANPQVIYVPSYNPQIVYGGWPYPYAPPLAYYPPGYVAGTAMLSFGVGMMVGAALWGGCHWGPSGGVTVNNNTFNQFNNNTNRNPIVRNGGSSNFNFDPSHRGNVGFNNSSLDQKYGNEVRNARNNETPQERSQAQQDRSGLQNQANADRNAGSQQQRQQMERSQAQQDRSTADSQARSDGFRDNSSGSEGGNRGGFEGGNRGGFGGARSGWGEEHGGGGFRGGRR